MYSYGNANTSVGGREGVPLVAITEIKAIVDTLDDLGIDPLHLHVDGHKPTDTRPDVQLWMRYRNWQVGERRYSAEHDTDGRRLLIQCVSFKHHDDYEGDAP